MVPRRAKDHAQWTALFYPRPCHVPALLPLSRNFQAFIDVHLMVTDPMKWVTPMAKAGIDSFTFHIEAKMPENGGIEELISALRAEKMQVGIALKPATPASAIAKYAHLIDLILVMTVEPGFSGQKFMSDMMPKVKELRTLYPSKHITVDGGLGPNTVDQATEVGANVIVSASAIFGSENREDVIKQLQASAENGLKNLAI